MIVDLLLGSDIGEWILDQVRPEAVGCVCTRDRRIAEIARDRRMAVSNDLEAKSPVALCAHFPNILTAEQLARWRVVYNLHPGFLPYGRGYAPVFWSIWAKEPAGAALHVMTARVDDGPIVERVRVVVRDDDTGGSLYRRVLVARKEIFSDWWPRLVSGQYPTGKAITGPGSYHSRAAFLRMRDHPPSEEFTEDDARRLERALSMPGYPAPQIRRGERPS